MFGVAHVFAPIPSIFPAVSHVLAAIFHVFFPVTNVLTLVADFFTNSPFAGRLRLGVVHETNEK